MSISGVPPEADPLALALTRYIRGQRAGVIGVAQLKRLTGGTSHETWAFDVQTDGAHTEPGIDHLILRRELEQEEAQLDLDLATEFRLLTHLKTQAVPVAAPLWSDEAEGIGVFMICERLNGTDVRKAMTDAAAFADVRATGQRLVSLLAQIHSLDWHKIPAGILAVRSADPVGREIARWVQPIAGLLGAPSPMLAAAVHWLETHQPATEQLVLVHGDYKANNILAIADGEFGILDWELAHIGDPIEDLAWTMMWQSRFDIVGGMLGQAEFIECYEQASGGPVDPVRLQFWKIYSLVKLAAIFLKGTETNAKTGRSAAPNRLMLERALPWIESQISPLMRGALELEGKS